MISSDQRSELAGTWTGQEEVMASAWSPAGTAEATFTIAASSAGALLIDYTQTRDGSVAVSGHGIVTSQGWWWFDSYGFVPAQPGTARWINGTLELQRRSERGRTVMSLHVDADVLTCEINTAVPADADLALMVLGRYTRA